MSSECRHAGSHPGSQDAIFATPTPLSSGFHIYNRQQFRRGTELAGNLLQSPDSPFINCFPFQRHKAAIDFNSLERGKGPLTGLGTLSAHSTTELWALNLMSHPGWAAGTNWVCSCESKELTCPAAGSFLIRLAAQAPPCLG